MVSGSGQLTYSMRRGNVLTFSNNNSGWSGGLVATLSDFGNTSNFSWVRPTANGALGSGNVTINDGVTLDIAASLGNTIGDSATVYLNSRGRHDASKFRLASNETIGALVVNPTSLITALTSGAGKLTVVGTATFGTTPMAITISNTGGIEAGGLTFNGVGTWSFSGNALTVSGGGTIETNANATISTLAAPAGFTKTGDGTLTLPGTLTLTSGQVAVSAGTLQLDGTLNGALQINANGTLTGTGGSASGAATLNGGTINLTSGTLGSTLDVTGGGNWNGAGTVTGLVTSSSGTFNIGSGANLTATSGLAVTGGTLNLDNTGTLTGDLTVASGAWLTGGGTVTGNATITGTHSPGNSPGLDDVGGDLTYNTGANVVWELISHTTDNSVGVRGVQFDGTDVGGALTFAGTTTMTLVFNISESTVDWEDPFWTSSYTGTDGWLVYSGATSLGGLSNLSVNKQNWLDDNSVSFNSLFLGGFSLYQDGNDIYLNYNYVPIPEPSSAILAALGALAMIRRRRR